MRLCRFPLSCTDMSLAAWSLSTKPTNLSDWLLGHDRAVCGRGVTDSGGGMRPNRALDRIS